jgi:glycosyltransferase involved in cell wall biosynthesis
MKILHICNYFIPQLGYQESYLARYQAEAGHNVEVITGTAIYPNGYYKHLEQIIGLRCRLPGVYTDEVGNVKVHRLSVLFERGMRVWHINLTKVVREIQPELIVLHGVTQFLTIRIALMRLFGMIGRNTRIIADEHMLFSILRRDIRAQMFYLFCRWGYFPFVSLLIDRFISVTSETKKFMEVVYGIDPKKIDTIDIGVDVRTFVFSETRRNACRKLLGLAESDIVFIHAGKIIQEKGAHLILNAAIPLMVSNPRVKLLFVGAQNVEYVAQLQDLIRIHSLETQVIWSAGVAHDQLLDFYCASDAGIWPTQESMTALEVCSCSRPVILSSSSVSAERISTGGGLMQTDEETLREAIRVLASDSELRIKMGIVSRLHMEAKYDWAIIAQKFSAY